MFLYLEKHEVIWTSFLMGALFMFALLTFIGLSMGRGA